MSVKAKLSAVFNRPIFCYFIPLVNKVLTKWRRQVWTTTRWDEQTRRFELYESKALINVDVVPAWMCSRDYLRKTLFRINLQGLKLKEGDVVVDIGSGTGTESLIFSDIVGAAGRVFAIEAHPVTFSSLKQLVSKGGYMNILPFQLAIGNKEGDVWIDDQSAHEKNAISMDHLAGQDVFGVRMLTLDEFVRVNGISKIDFLKVNIEGAEEWMLEGMQDSIHIIQNAAISCHDFLSNDGETRIMTEVRTFFEKSGFIVAHYPNAHPVMNSWLYMSRE